MLVCMELPALDAVDAQPVNLWLVVPVGVLALGVHMPPAARPREPAFGFIEDDQP